MTLSEKIDGASISVVEQFGDWPNEAGFEALHEQKTPVELLVQGVIPEYAAEFSTVKDREDISHRFELVPSPSGMKVLYNSRLACDILLQDVEESGNWKKFSFGQKRDPCTSFFGKVMSSFKVATGKSRQRFDKNPSFENIAVTFSVNMPGHATTASTTSELKTDNSTSNPHRPKHASSIQSLYSKTDSSCVKQLDPETLEPIGLASQESLHPSLAGPLSSAHARTDPNTGDLFNYNLDIGREAIYRVFTISAATGQTSILASISGPGVAAAYLHSLFLTPDYVILCVWSSHFAKNGLSLIWNFNVLDAIAPFSSANKPKWFVIDRHRGHGLVGEFESEAMFSFHTTNAWQDGEDVVCELVAYENTDILHKFYYDAIKSSSPEAHTWAKRKLPGCQASLRWYKLSGVQIKTSMSLERRKIKNMPQAEEIMKLQMGELATINPWYSCKPHRFLYSVVDRGLSTFFDGLAKIDTETRKTIYWENEVGHTPGEAVFIPNPDLDGEDDGVVLSVVLDGNSGTSYLLCLDAKTMKDVGRAEVCCAVGFGFHGAFVGYEGEAQST